MKAVVVGGLLLLGSALMLLAAIGIVRLPDVFTRMHAATKPSTLGIGLIIAGVAVHFQDLEIATRAVLIAAFFLLTVPVGAHMIGRAAYLIGTPLWEGTVVDEWHDKPPVAGGGA
jgi:multicomponent Na+:H+ antiporter subunit G